MNISVFDIKNNFHSDFTPQVQAVNEAYWVETSTSSWESVSRKELQILPKTWFFHYERAPAYQALSAEEFLTKIIVGLKHLRIHRLARNYFWLFPKVKPRRMDKDLRKS
jgi:hypothetical protein